MERKLRIRERFKLINKKSPVSGHEWFEHGPTTGYEVIGPTGVLATCRTLPAAEKQKAEWEAYYNKFGWPGDTWRD